EIAASLGKPVNFSRISGNYTLRVLGQSLFTQDLGRFTDVVNREFTVLIDLTEKRLTRLFPFPTPARIRENRDLKKSLHEIDQVILEVINHAKSQKRMPKENF